MVTDHQSSYVSAVSDFREARRKAWMHQILSSLTGESTQLLSYEDVRKQLKGRAGSEQGLRDIPLDAIVGSVGRYTDFSRSFLPLQDSDAERWARIKVATTGMAGLPPIEVYQIGDAYFVKDGNHRVSVARELGADYIQAYVTKVNTKVPLEPDTDPNDLIIKAEYADFLETTHLDEIRPQADLTVTAPGKYEQLLEHIRLHQYFMGHDLQRDISWEEAVGHWYDAVYRPTVEIIQASNLLEEFPDRTETDLYLWLTEHKAAVEETLGWEVAPETAAKNLVDQYSSKTANMLGRISQKLWDAMLPDELESGPPPGQWRAERLAARRGDRLFCGILVAINGQENGWKALDEAIEIARREETRLKGLHVVPTEAAAKSAAVAAIRAEFERRCAQAGLDSEFAIVAGKVGQTIIERAYWVDLVVISLNHPPQANPFQKFRSELRTFLQRCPRPILAVPRPLFPLHRVLLAYDGSPKSKEALFIATYIAARWPDITLTVMTVAQNGNVGEETLAHARAYLEEHSIDAEYILAGSGPVAPNILITAEERDINLIIMGGYGQGVMLEALFGSVVDEVLRSRQRPVLICR